MCRHTVKWVGKWKQGFYCGKGTGVGKGTRIFSSSPGIPTAGGTGSECVWPVLAAEGSDWDGQGIYMAQ